jgi:hypothetical protein
MMAAAVKIKRDSLGTSRELRVSFNSSIYGFSVRLNEQVPGIAVDKFPPASPDIHINFGEMPSWLSSQESPKEIRYVSPDGVPGEPPRLIAWHLVELDCYQLRYADGTEFLVDKLGTRIWATWPEQTLTLEDTATYLLGPVMGFVLLLRGCVSLHASAIAIDNSAVAIVGPAGSGKSTTAAALADLGYSILAEDVVTLQDLDTKFLVQPAYPCIRLWPASVKALYGEDRELPKLTPTWDKCYLDLTQEQYQFQTNALPLAAIYLLDERSSDPSSPKVSELSPGEALISLIANTYATYLMDKAMRAREFELLGRVLKSVPVRKVIPHTDPLHIQTLCQTIIMDFEKLNTRKGPTEPLDHAVHV